jgi:hypothetical protein
MTTIRALTGADKREAKDIWELRFHDSLSFTDWFFSERFAPETSFCAVEDGRIISIAHGSPMELRIRNVTFPAMMISGVATLSGYEGRGLMKRVMFRLLENCKELTIPLAFHTPSHFSIYRTIGEFPCADALSYTCKDSPNVEPVWDEVPSAAELLSVYDRASACYSGCVVRTEAFMQKRIHDLLRDGGVCLTHASDGVLDGYLFAAPDGEAYASEEAFAVSQEVYAALVSRLPGGCVVKLPPDVDLPGNIYPQGIVIPVDVPSLLRSLCGEAKALHLRVIDPMLPWNNGVFDGAGNLHDDEPEETLSAGRLMQFMCGYLPYKDVFTQLPCFCADEY